MSSVFILGIAGGSCSGKTTLTQYVKEAFGEKANVLAQDNFYIDQSHRFDRDGGSVNFDHPSSIDFSLMGECIKGLKAGKDVAIPVYDFATHTRAKETHNVESRSLIIIDGTLILSQDVVSNLLDASFFMDTPEDIRFQRRLDRDTRERGRTEQGVKDQFYKQVKPMHDEWVGPSKSLATHVFSGDMKFPTDSALNTILENIKKRLLL